MNSQLFLTLFAMSILLPCSNSTMEQNKKVIKINKNIKRAQNGELEALNERGTKGYAILHYACLKNDISLVRRVLTAGVAVNCQNINGITPLHIVCGNSNVMNNEIVQLLFDNNANKNCVDVYGNGPLHFALACGKYKLASELIKVGVEVNLANKYGSTPLHFAAAKNEICPISELIAAGAKIDCTDNEGRTPFDIANMLGNVLASNALMLAAINQDDLQWEDVLP